MGLAWKSILGMRGCAVLLARGMGGCLVGRECGWGPECLCIGLEGALNGGEGGWREERKEVHTD